MICTSPKITPMLSRAFLYGSLYKRLIKANEHIARSQGSRKEIIPINEAVSIKDIIMKYIKNIGIYEKLVFIDSKKEDLIENAPFHS